MYSRTWIGWSWKFHRHIQNNVLCIMSRTTNNACGASRSIPQRHAIRSQISETTRKLEPTRLHPSRNAVKYISIMPSSLKKTASLPLYLLQIWMLVNHRQPKQHREHREDREYRRRRLLNEPWTRPMETADIWRICRSKRLDTTSLARVQFKAHRTISYRRETIRDISKSTPQLQE